MRYGANFVVLCQRNTDLVDMRLVLSDPGQSGSEATAAEDRCVEPES
jgi:hypothetical protein